MTEQFEPGRFTTLLDDPRYADLPLRRKPGPARLSDPNPQVLRFGPGPAGKTCRTCVHLDRYHQVARWAKCELRQIREGHDGGRNDQKAGWPACARYEPLPDADPVVIPLEATP